MIGWLKASGIALAILTITGGFCWLMVQWCRYCIQQDYGLAVFMAPSVLIVFAVIVASIRASLGDSK